MYSLISFTRWENSRGDFGIPRDSSASGRPCPGLFPSSPDARRGANVKPTRSANERIHTPERPIVRPEFPAAGRPVLFIALLPAGVSNRNKDVTLVAFEPGFGRADPVSQPVGLDRVAGFREEGF